MEQSEILQYLAELTGIEGHAFHRAILLEVVVWFVMIAAVIIDFSTGIRKARVLKIPRDSHGFRRSFEKFGDYGKVTGMLMLFDLLAILFGIYSLPYASGLAGVGVVYTEYKSVRENLTAIRYKSVDMYTSEPGTATLTFKGENGEEKTLTVQKVDGPAVWQGAHNKEKSIRSFARACFQYAIDTRQDLWFSTKDTIAKIYDGTFKRVFEEEFEHYKADFEKLGITYFYTLIDDAVARVIRSEGGFIWACKNYDGDVMSDMVSTAFGSLAMMTSVLVSPDGTTEFEAAHGTVTKHYYKHLKGEETSTNPMATIFAWTGALRKRGQLDGLTDLAAFADKLESACFATLNQGIMTKDLAGLVDEGFKVHSATSAEFIAAIRHDLEKVL